MNTFDVKTVLNRVYAARLPDRDDIEFLLSVNDRGDLKVIFDFADRVKKEFCGDAILSRGLIEFSNRCHRNCLYCGLNKSNKALTRYRLSSQEIMVCVEKIAASGIETVVLQSGEDDSLDPLWLEDIVRKIKLRYNALITLSAGEKAGDIYKLWKTAGADRYLLKIETANKKLYETLHPAMDFNNRLRCLNDLRELGYEVGSGNIIGLKGQRLKDIAGDIIFFKERKFDMIAIGPFIPHRRTGFAKQSRGDANLTLKALALTRIVTKGANMPATRALGNFGMSFKLKALRAGANVLMPNFTPLPYRKLYEIYDRE